MRTRILLVYLVGVITGLVLGRIITLTLDLTSHVQEVIAESDSAEMSVSEPFSEESDLEDRGELILFEKEGAVVEGRSFEVFRVLEDGKALAREGEYISNFFIATGVEVLFLGDSLSYYDGQVIKVPKGKYAKQIGIYRYCYVSDRMKTIPVVKIGGK